jgi:hypothetical protein
MLIREQKGTTAKASGAGKASKPPGPIIATVVVVALVVLICLQHGWWPSRFGRMRWADPLLFGAAALVGLAVAGTAWAIRTLYLVARDRRRSWWILPAPAAVLVASAIGLLVPPTSFDEARPAFEALAQELLAGPERHRRELEIGRFDISYAMADANGAVYFIEATGFGLTTSSGWVYSPNGEPAGFDDFSAKPLGGPWYEFTAVWRT